MKIIKIKRLTPEDFSKYGMYADMTHPQGEVVGQPPCEFYRDMISFKSILVNSVCFSDCKVYKRDMVVEESEIHNYCSEGNLPLDGDIVIHVAPAGAEKKPPVDKIEAFLVPKGTFVQFNPGVWHGAAFPYGSDTVNIMIALPERTYFNDCTVLKLEEKVVIEK